MRKKKKKFLKKKCARRRDQRRRTSGVGVPEFNKEEGGSRVGDVSARSQRSLRAGGQRVCVCWWGGCPQHPGWKQIAPSSIFKVLQTTEQSSAEETALQAGRRGTSPPLSVTGPGRQARGGGGGFQPGQGQLCFFPPRDPAPQLGEWPEKHSHQERLTLGPFRGLSAGKSVGFCFSHDSAPWG